MVLKKRNFQNSLLKLANTLMAVASRETGPGALASLIWVKKEKIQRRKKSRRAKLNKTVPHSPALGQGLDLLLNGCPQKGIHCEYGSTMESHIFIANQEVRPHVTKIF